MALKDTLGESPPATPSLVVVNRTVPRPLQTMLEDLFADQPITVETAVIDDEDDDMVYLVADGELLATSPLQALQDCLLLVNSDLYVTGDGGFEDLQLPAVIERLENVRFSVRGYPASDKEKLLLIIISRYIERLALTGDGGTFRASFQRLSRIEDEHGTGHVYERLAGADTAVHVYGVPDWVPPRSLDVVTHAGWGADFRDSWFTVYRPAGDGRHAALLAVQGETGVWDALWTFDPEAVVELDAYIQRRM